MPKMQPIPVEERFWRHTKWRGDCLEWIGCRNAKGYGTIRHTHSSDLTHRVAWELYTGKRPGPDTLVLHHCDNPPCVRREHLYLGDHAQNARDKMQRGRHIAPRGAENGNAKLTPEAVRDIRSRCAAGERRGDVAYVYGVTVGTVHHVMQGRTWRHLI